MLAKKIAFGFGIAIILPLLVHYGVRTFRPAPKLTYDSSYYTQYRHATPEQRKKLDAERTKKMKEYQHHRESFAKDLFYVAVPVGIAAIIIGARLAVNAVGAGLIFGGIFTLTDGYCWYWSSLPDWMRFVSLLAAFAVLVVCGYAKLNGKSSVQGEASQEQRPT